jgi:hypothetical protein
MALRKILSQFTWDLATIPPPQAGENEVERESLFRTLALIRRKLEGKDAGQRIIYNGDLMHKFFGIGPERALTAIILVMGELQHKYESIEVQISEQLSKLTTKGKWIERKLTSTNSSQSS